MKIYFAAAIRGGRQDRQLYQQLINFLVMNKHQQVLTEHIGAKHLTSTSEEQLSDQQIRDRDVKLLKEADLVVAETTQPSLGVGYELGYAERLEIPVIILHRQGPNRLSAMINGTAFFTNINYYSTLDDAKRILSQQLQHISREMDQPNEDRH
ncbi:nucleoside 2-deoxyribosyltransferase [uncultured Limosilactobacillus sp.]|uniref:nucleoside 2-deoxyribosyltransferase n=1 Tax=uncultured Limosilactobacillus sp. TaxID=2837629 RepID=UPI0025DC1F88|nr:nucleoside 2-deoxyribosyltransferase [uncultured Limosilactobacillus sp.]